MGAAHIEYRVYDKDGVSKTPINQNLIGEINFGANAGGGYGELALDLAVSFDTTLYMQSDIVEVIRYKDGESSLLFAGEFSTTKRTEDKDTKVNVSVFGLFTILQSIPYSVGTLSGTPTQLLKDAIDYYQGVSGRSGADASYLGDNLIYYTADSIDNDVSTVSIETQKSDSVWSVMLKIAATNQDKEIFVDVDGKVIWKGRPANATHIISKDIMTNKFAIEETPVINSISIARNGGTVIDYDDAASIAIYGTKWGGLITKNDIGDSTTQDKYGNSYIDKHKTPRNQISATINNRYNLSLLKPLDTVYFTNTGLELDNELIMGIRYNSKSDEMELIFENIDTLNKVFISPNNNNGS